VTTLSSDVNVVSRIIETGELPATREGIEMTTTVTATWSASVGALWDEALANLQRNTVTAADGSTYIRAGAGYADPWTRDAALNSWGAANVVRPGDARSTLLRVCETLPDGQTVIAQDDQWWDQIAWVLGAYDHSMWSGDRVFLRQVLEIGSASLAILDRDRFRPAWGLYAGPALMQDGISGLPTPPASSDEPTSFVLDYPDAQEIMSLSTNALYFRALRLLALAAAALGEDATEYERRSADLAAAINAHLRDGEGRYGYFVHGSGRSRGALDPHREAAGLALAVVFGIAESPASAVLASMDRRAAGVVNVGPHFPDRYSDERPGRHNVMCWPMVMGLVGLAEAVADDGDVHRTMDDFSRLVAASGGRFDEVYHPASGVADGGWQCGFRWPSEPDQTWSATSYIRLVLEGLLGARASLDEVTFAPAALPEGGVLEITGIPWRASTIDIVVRATPDGAPLDRTATVPADATGSVRCELTVPAVAVPTAAAPALPPRAEA